MKIHCQLDGRGFYVYSDKRFECVAWSLLVTLHTFFLFLAINLPLLKLKHVENSSTKVNFLLVKEPA